MIGIFVGFDDFYVTYDKNIIHQAEKDNFGTWEVFSEPWCPPLIRPIFLD